MLRLCLILSMGLTCGLSAAGEDIVVVVNQNDSIGKFSRDEVIDIFMGRNRQLAPGLPAQPIDLPNSIEHESFYLRLTGKSVGEINAYWARLHFTGRATPPTLVNSQDEAIKKVIENRGALAYISRNKLNPQVKVVFELNDK